LPSYETRTSRLRLVLFAILGFMTPYYMEILYNQYWIYNLKSLSYKDKQIKCLQVWKKTTLAS
jgi:hypothetical protein